MSQSSSPATKPERDRTAGAGKWEVACALAASVVAAVVLGFADWIGFLLEDRDMIGCPNPCPDLQPGEECVVPDGWCEDYAARLARSRRSFVQDLPTVVAVALLVVAFIPGWVRAMRFPQPRIAKTIMAGIGVLAIFAAWHGAVYVVYVATLAIFVAFMGEMVRKDGRENLLGQVAGTYLGCLIVCSAALWLCVAKADARGLMSVVAVIILFGSLGRYATKTGRTLLRGASARWALPVWLTVCAFVAGVVLVVAVEPTSNPGPYVLVACVALGFGVSASLADLAAKGASSKLVAVSLAVLPHCVLGAVGYASILILQ